MFLFQYIVEFIKLGFQVFYFTIVVDFVIFFWIMWEFVSMESDEGDCVLEICVCFLYFERS